MQRHLETFLQLDELGQRFPEFQPNFAYPAEYIDSFHRGLAEAPLKDGLLVQLAKPGSRKIIPGFLRRADALKLYELAYFAAGDILEIGIFQGLSGTILARATRNSGKPERRIVSVDLNLLRLAQTFMTLASQGLLSGRQFRHGDAASVVRKLAREGRQFGFSFIDHSHAYRPVLEVCQELPKVMAPGGFCLFHDYNDERNREPGNDAYKVYQAVADGLPSGMFTFCGIYGCTALYQRTN